MSNKITLETLAIVCDLRNCCTYWSKHLNDPVYDEIRLLLMKYTGFVNYDKVVILKKDQIFEFNLHTTNLQG